MPAWILPLLAAFALLSASPAHARVLVARMASVSTPVATLQGVQVRLDWPADAEVGELRITAQRADAPDLGQHFAGLSWHCPLRRDGQGGWACAGELRQGRGAPLRLELALPPGRVSAALSGAGGSRLALRRDGAAPDLFAIDITRVPVAWAEALARRAWPGVRLGDGRLGGHLQVRVPDAAPMRLTGELALDGGSFDSADGTQAGAGLGARLGIDWLAAEAGPRLAIDGELLGGELLFGSGYFVLPATPVPVRLRAQGVADGWALDEFLVRDPGVLEVQGRAELDGGGLRALALSLRSADAARLPERYLSGWLGQAGLTGLVLTGGLDADVEIIDGALAGFALRARGVDVAAPDGRFRFQALDGDVRLVSAGRVDSTLRWQSAAIGAIPFGPARLPWRSSDGELHLREGVGIAMLGGRLDIPALRLRPAGGRGPLLVEAALGVESLDMATLAAALGLPAFPGTLTVDIPSARYVGDRLDFEGGVVARAFDGEVRVSSLAMERPFGVAPTLLADIALDGLDLQALTGVLEVGGISGRLHGRIDGLRLVDWEPAAFDAELHTEPRRGVRQRISQRAVQDISSVGDASFTASLQGQLLALFDDFGYRRIGISCRLANGVCTMAGLQPRGSGFVIVEGAGLPRLDIVGYNRRVDWETLVERVVAAGSGEVSPVFD